MARRSPCWRRVRPWLFSPDLDHCTRLTTGALGHRFARLARRAGVEGIDDEPPRRLSEWQQAALDFTVPAVPSRYRLVECIGEDRRNKRVVVFDIETSPQLQANRKDEVYLRVGDENRRLTFTQRQELFYDKGQSAYEHVPRLVEVVRW